MPPDRPKWVPHPGPQTRALQVTAFETLFGGARGPGKTDCAIVWMAKPIAFPRYRGLVIRRNAKDLADWLDRAEFMYAAMGGKVVGQPPEIRFPSGAKIRTGHLKDENAYTAYQGHEYQRINIEELTQIPTEEQYLMLLGSCRSTLPEIDARVFNTSNPGGAGHSWVRKRFVSVAAPGVQYTDPKTGLTRVFIPGKVTDNPTLMKIDPRYLGWLDSLPEPLRSAWRDGNWDVFIGQFFKTFDRMVNVVRPYRIPEHWVKYRSVDYGYGAPSAVGWYASSETGKLVMYRELWITDQTYEQLADEIKLLSGGEHYQHTVVDPSICNKREQRGESFMTGSEILATKGIYVIPGDNNRIEGWRRMHSLFSMGKLEIFDTCLKTIETIPAQQHSKTNVEDMQKNNTDHMTDSIRYMVMSRPMPSGLGDGTGESISYDQRVHAFVRRRRERIANARRGSCRVDPILGSKW